MSGFSSSYSPLFLILFLAISIAASVYFYRNAILPKWKKNLLISVKSLAVFLLLALFAEPILSSLINPSKEKLDVILIDDSRSLTLQNKSEKIKEITENNGLLSGNPKVFTFSNILSPLNSMDSFYSGGYETDLSSALKNLKTGFPDRQFNSVTIISDGMFNAGGNPLYEAKTFNAPFITVPIGDTAQQKDIVIKNTLYNENAFTNINVKIKVFLNIHRVSGSLNLNLKREGSTITTKTINIESGKDNYEAEFDITESTAGKIKYHIEAENNEGEITYKNNYNDFFINYFDNKINILAISGAPSYDDALIFGDLRRMNSYNITFRTAKTGSEFYEGAIDTRSLPELSAIFLLNFPTGQTDPGIITLLTESSKTHKIPVIFFAGKNTDYQKLQSFGDILPFNVSRPSSGESMFNLQIVSSDENPLTKISGINSAAQIFRNVSGIQPKPGALTLGIDKSSGEPVIITRTSGNEKSTAFLGYGLWRWRLNSSSNSEKPAQEMLLELINLSLQKEKKTKFRIYPENDVFDYSQQVKILAEVYDDNYNPTRNASVNGRILDLNGKKIADLKFKADENKYSAVIDPVSVGDYKIEGDAELNGSFYANDNSRFLVDSVNTEFLETKTNIQALGELSQNTGGFLISGDSLNEMRSLINSIQNTNIKESDSIGMLRYNLWENKFYLALIILLFTIEWVFRKRNNIP